VVDDKVDGKVHATVAGDFQFLLDVCAVFCENTRNRRTNAVVLNAFVVRCFGVNASRFLLPTDLLRPQLSPACDGLTSVVRKAGSPVQRRSATRYRYPRLFGNGTGSLGQLRDDGDALEWHTVAVGGFEEGASCVDVPIAEVLHDRVSGQAP
jgi:hypothetical protein